MGRNSYPFKCARVSAQFFKSIIRLFDIIPLVDFFENVTCQAMDIPQVET
jgi:hypothetical protein